MTDSTSVNAVSFQQAFSACQTRAGQGCLDLLLMAVMRGPYRDRFLDFVLTREASEPDPVKYCPGEFVAEVQAIHAAFSEQPNANWRREAAWRMDTRAHTHIQEAGGLLVIEWLLGV